MGDDWDLYAVVRSCTSAVNTSSSATATSASNDFTKEKTSYPLAFEKELDGSFSFPNLSRKSGFLQDSYKPFLPYADPTTITTTTTTTNQGIDPSYVPGGSSGQHHQHLNLHHQQPTTTSSSSSIGVSSQLNPTSAPIFGFGQSAGNQLQLQQRVQRPTSTTAALPLRNLQPHQPPRSRKRKNQQKRTVCHVTADNLSSDPWAWRKYGQKPIKGSPYPRNYYRCSSSKGCSARKQVERSNLDPNSFIVTYTGDHTHPRPTHRNSLAGSTRNKPSAIRKAGGSGDAASKDSVPKTLPSGTASCSSPRSATSLSPISPKTPLSAPENAAGVSVHNAGDADINGGEEEEEESVDMGLETAPDEESDDDDILIPNVHVDDDLFEGLEELIGGGAAGDGL